MSTSALEKQAVRTRRPRRTEGSARTNLFVYAIAAVVVAVTLGPVLYGVLSGFRTNTDLSRDRKSVV